MGPNFRKGDHIFIVLKNGTSFEGNVKNLSQAGHRLSLMNVVQHPGNIKIEGYRNFESIEIHQIKLMHFSDSSSDIVDGIKLCNEEIASAASMSLPHVMSDVNYKEILAIQNSFRYINNADTNFYAAISLLKESKMIGLCVKDCMKGRNQRASVIAVATATNIFIFDLMTMGDKAFDKGLRDILQSSSVEKIVHDCRLVSDCLYHKHQTCLTNIRDVEAEDIIVVHQERGYIRKHTRPFSYLVELYLGLPSHILDENCKSDHWGNRPLSLQHQQVLASNTSFLIPLHRAIVERYSSRLIEASRIYNEYIRNSDMFICITEGSKYVLRNQFVDLVKYKSTCRTTREREENYPDE